MKYKVIGWTYYDDNEILYSGNTIGFAERNAIIDEIRKHRYLFSGWHHQESWEGVVPVLNDGKKRCYSQRGWGGVMAKTYYLRGRELRLSLMETDEATQDLIDAYDHVYL